MNFWQKCNSMLRKIPLWAVGFGAGVLFLVIGTAGGELERMYRKAVMVCLECIGIG